VALTPGVKPWDLAALRLLVEEAGGVFTDFEGKPTIYSSTAFATNGRLHAAALALGEAARAAGDRPVAALAEALGLHARSEEEVFYPAAVLVGDIVRNRAGS